MKSKFIAGLVASLISLVFVAGAATIMVVVFDLDQSNKPFIYGIAFACIAIWTGIYNWLKPKEEANDQNNDGVHKFPPRNT